MATKLLLNVTLGVANTTLNNTMDTNDYHDYYDEEESQQQPENRVDEFVIMNILVSVGILLGNAFVVFLFYYRPALLAKPSNKFLLSLSICDFFSGLGVGLHVFLIVSPILEDEGCEKCFLVRVFIDIITTFLVETAIIHLCIITADRFLSLFFALRYRDIITRPAVNIFILFAWLIPFLTSMLQITYLYPLIQKGHDITDEEDKMITKGEKWYSIVSFTVFMVFPFLANGIAFIVMFREIRKLLLKTPSRRLQLHSAVSSQERRVIKIFSLMYLCFAFLTLPYFTIRLLIDLRYEVENIPHVFNVVYTLKSVTSLCNPILYTGMNKEFRSIACLWIRKRSQQFGDKVRKISITPRHCPHPGKLPKVAQRSYRISVSDQGGRSCDSGIFDAGSPAYITVTEPFLPPTTSGSESSDTSNSLDQSEAKEESIV